MEAPQVSIVIPIYREAEILEQAVTRLVGGLDRRGIRYELLLVEQFSDQRTLDTSLEVVAAFRTSGTSCCPRRTSVRPCAVGMLEAQGSVIVNFDIDYWDISFVRMCLATMLEFDIDVVIGSKNARLSVDNRAFDRPDSSRRSSGSSCKSRSACASATPTASKRGIGARA